MAEGIIKLGDFKDIQSKELVEKQIFNKIKPHVGTWANRCSLQKVQAPFKTYSIRSVVFPKAPDASGVNLLEGITPDATGSLTYVEQIFRLKPKGFYSYYTDEDMTYGFDPIVADLSESVINQGQELIDNIVANAFLGGNNVYTCASGLTREDFIKIRISLLKFTNKKGQRVRCILTPEDVAELRLKYNSAGQNLFHDLPANEASVIDGVIARFEGVDIEEDYSNALYYKDSAGKDARHAVFYVDNSQGKKPVVLTSPDSINGEFIAKALGSSGSKDPLNQRGSIGMKFKGLDAGIASEECVVRVDITPSTIAKVDSGFEYLNGAIKAFGKNVERSGETSKEVSPNKLIKVVLDKSVLSIAKSETATITATDAITGTTLTTTATSLDTSIATIATGKITPVKAGEVAIKVSATGYTDAIVGVVVKA